MVKICSMVLYFTEACIYVFSGVYGNLHDIGPGNAILIILQLSVVGMVLVLLDDCHQKGYGLGRSFTSITIALNTCCDVVWQIAAPVSVFSHGKSQFIGVIPAVVQEIIQSIYHRDGGVLRLLYRVFIHRGNGLAVLASLVSTILVALLVLYVIQCKVVIPLIYQPAKRSTERLQHANAEVLVSHNKEYIIPLLFTSTTSIMLHSTILSNVFLISRYLSNLNPKYGLVRMLCEWGTPKGQPIEEFGEHFA